jgi:hypothetical protein
MLVVGDSKPNQHKKITKMVKKDSPFPCNCWFIISNFEILIRFIISSSSNNEHVIASRRKQDFILQTNLKSIA